MTVRIMTITVMTVRSHDGQTPKCGQMRPDRAHFDPIWAIPPKNDEKDAREEAIRLTVLTLFCREKAFPTLEKVAFRREKTFRRLGSEPSRGKTRFQSFQRPSLDDGVQFGSWERRPPLVLARI